MTDDNTYTTQARDSKFNNDGTEGSIQTVPDEVGETDMYGVINAGVAEQLGEFFTVTVSEEAEVMAQRTGETKRFGKYETPSGAAYGIGINRDVLADVTGEELPDSVGLLFTPNTQEDWDEALEEAQAEQEASVEDEAAGLVSGGDDSDDEEDEPEEVGISDEELGLVGE